MNETVALLAAALAHATYGVTALLASVPRIAGHAAPAPLAAIYDRNQHPWVARGDVPRDNTTVLFPSLAVTLAEAATMETSVKTGPSGRVAAGSVTVAVQYLTRDPATADAALASGYVLRAVRGSLLRYAADRDAVREMNGVRLVCLAGPLRTFAGPISVNDALVAGLVLATWTTYETTPLL